MRSDVHRRALERAVQSFGSAEAVAAILNVPRRRLDMWLSGSLPVSADMFVAIVDMLLERGLSELKEEISYSNEVRQTSRRHGEDESGFG